MGDRDAAARLDGDGDGRPRSTVGDLLRMLPTDVFNRLLPEEARTGLAALDEFAEREGDALMDVAGDRGGM